MASHGTVWYTVLAQPLCGSTLSAMGCVGGLPVKGCVRGFASLERGFFPMQSVQRLFDVWFFCCSHPLAFTIPSLMVFLRLENPL
jgi:hypothetical protein